MWLALAPSNSTSLFLFLTRYQLCLQIQLFEDMKPQKEVETFNSRLPEPFIASYYHPSLDFCC